MSVLNPLIHRTPDRWDSVVSKRRLFHEKNLPFFDGIRSRKEDGLKMCIWPKEANVVQVWGVCWEKRAQEILTG